MSLTRAARRSLVEFERAFSPTKIVSSNATNNDCSERQGQRRREREGHQQENTSRSLNELGISFPPTKLDNASVTNDGDGNSTAIRTKTTRIRWVH